jgi:formylglycine-generating enzyme
MTDGSAGAALHQAPSHPEMVRIPGGEFLMGSEAFYPEERPVHRVAVDGFWMDLHAVTAADFERFVGATGYVTVAERALDPTIYPGADPALLVPGSVVFRPTSGPVDLGDNRLWWHYTPGASWRHPGGPQTSTAERESHPVVQVAFQDARAYADWVGKSLPTEAEWEFAARGGLEGAVFAWGDEHAPGGRPMANTWQGEFPFQNLKLDGFAGTSPVGSFPPNGYGLYDVAGNVWEWTRDWFAAHLETHACCVPRNPRPLSPEWSSEMANAAGPDIPRKVIKGGSHLCAPNYCLRYRPAARQAHPVDTGTSHLGFRCIVRGEVKP